MERKIQELTERIVAKRREIWEEEPEEIRVLMKTPFPKSNTFASVMYAYAEIYHFTKNVHLHRNLVAQNRIVFKEMMRVLSAYLGAVSKRYNTWFLVDSAKIVGEVAEALERAESPDEVILLLDELLIYNNKLCVWLDSRIPWFKLGKQIQFS